MFNSSEKANLWRPHLLRKFVHDWRPPERSRLEAGEESQNCFSSLIARNPLKKPDSDEENKIKPRKTKEIKAQFAWISFVWLGFAWQKPDLRLAAA
jgi:hypothetical protein